MQKVIMFDMQSRLSSNMITFCMTDFLKPYPNVTVMSHNLGGNIPFEIDRMDHRNMCDTPDLELPSKKLKTAPVVVDCNSLSGRAIEPAVHVYGADKIVFGSDGTDFGMNWTNNAINEARITDAEKQAIRDGNARRLLARSTAAPPRPRSKFLEAVVANVAKLIPRATCDALDCFGLRPRNDEFKISSVILVPRWRAPQSARPPRSHHRPFPFCHSPRTRRSSAGRAPCRR